MLVPHIAVIGYHVSLSSNEGWNAYQARHAMGMGGVSLYPPPGGMVFNNYPPSSFYVVGALGWLLGDMILAGRIVSLFAMLFCAFATGRIVTIMGGTRAAAWFAGLLVIFYAAVFYSDYVVMNDPQWLAEAIIMAGFVLLLGNRGNARDGMPAWRAFCAGLVMVAGLTFKHNILALPLAITLWLLVTDRRGALAWMLGGVVGVSVLGGLFYACFGPDFIHGVFGHKRIFQIHGAVKGVGNVLGLGGMMVSALLLPRLGLRNRMGLLLGTYLFWSVLSVVIQRTGAGVTHNACFEALIAAALCAGLAVSGMERGMIPPGRMPARMGVVMLAGLDLLPIVACAPVYVPFLYRSTAEVMAHEPAWRETIGAVRHMDGNVGCETLAICYWAGKPVVMDFFNYSQHVAVTHDATALRQALDSHGIVAFVSSSRFLPPRYVWEYSSLWAIIRDRYTHVQLRGVAYIVTP